MVSKPLDSKSFDSLGKKAEVVLKKKKGQRFQMFASDSQNKKLELSFSFHPPAKFAVFLLSFQA